MTPARNEEPASGAIAFVVFGVTGDLTRRKLIPALYELALSGRLLNVIYPWFCPPDWSDEFCAKHCGRRLSLMRAPNRLANRH
jgi:glucose-6-phosphate 1-dehydrogenase